MIQQDDTLLSRYLSGTLTPEEDAATAPPPKVGFLEGLTTAATGRKRNPVDFVGYASTVQTLNEWSGLARAGRAAQDGEATPEQVAALQQWAEFNEREVSIGGQVGQILAQAPAFMQEMLGGGGIATGLGKSAAGKALRESVESAIEKLGSREITKGLLRGGAQGAAIAGVNETLTLGAGVKAEAYQRMFSSMDPAISREEAGELAVTFNATGDSFLQALPEAVFSVLVEPISERSGSALGKLGPVSRTKAAMASVFGWWTAKTGQGSGAFSVLVQRAGWDGIIEEWLEERYAGALRAGAGAAGMDFDPLEELFPGVDQLVAEGIAFGIMGTAIEGARQGADKALGDGTPKEEITPEVEVTPGLTKEVDDSAPVVDDTAQETPPPGPQPSVQDAPKETVSGAAEEGVRGPEGAPTTVRIGERDYATIDREAWTPEQSRGARALQRLYPDLDVSIVPDAEADFGGVTTSEGMVALSESVAADVPRIPYHEAVHVLSFAEGGVEGLYSEVRGIDAQGLRIASRRKRARLRAAGGPALKAAEGAPRDLRREETLATRAEDLAAYFELLGSSEGRKHIQRILRTDRGLLERILDAVRKVGARVFGGDARTTFEREVDELTEALRVIDPDSPEADTVSAKVAATMRRTMARARVAKATAELEQPRYAPSSVSILSGKEDLGADKDKPGLRSSVSAMGRAFERRAEEQGYRVADPNKLTREEEERVSEAMAEEILYQLSLDSSAVGWYDRKVKAALKLLAKRFPEIGKDPDAKAVFTAVLAVTSNGQDVHANFKQAVAAYSAYRETGRMPADMKFGGDRAPVIKRSVFLIQRMIDEWGIPKMRKFLETEVAVSELKKKGWKVTGEPAKYLAPGSVVFGPKLGAFYGNLNGDFSRLTADVWFTRTYNRLIGHLAAWSPESIVRKRKSFVVAAKAAKMRVTAKNADELAGKMERELSKADYKYARISEDESVQEAYRKANSLVKELKEPLQRDPRNLTEKTRMRRIVERAQELVRESGTDISVADIQAVLWYHEKQLYVQQGAANARGEAADYEDAARGVLADLPARSGDVGGGARGGSGDAGAQRGAREAAEPAVEIGRFAPMPEYQGEHGAPGKGSGNPLHRVNEDVYPDDVYSLEGLQYYGTGSELDSRAWAMIQDYRGSPNRPVTIYRAVPKDAPPGINPGDWVTIVRRYATDHGHSALGGDFRIQKKSVFARDLFTNGDSWLEWGYDPQPRDVEADRRKAARRRAIREGKGPDDVAPRFAPMPPGGVDSAAFRRKPKTEREKRAARKKSKIEKVAQSIVNGFDQLPDEGRTDTVLRALQNRYNRIDRFVEAILSSSGLVTEDTHVREWIKRLPGRIESRIKKFTRLHQNKIRDHLRKHKISLADGGRYLYVRHVPEANEHGIAKDPEGGWNHTDRPFSGLASAQAEREQAEFEAREGYAELGKMVDAMNAETRRTQLEYGLITQEQYDAWEGMFDHYVPLRNPDPDNGLPLEPRGKGFQVRGPESRARGGRGELETPESTLVWSVAQGHGAIMRGEQTQIGQTFARLLRENEGLATFEDVEGGTPGGLSDAELKELTDTSFVYKEAGVERRIILKDKLLVRAMKDLGSEHPGWLVSKLATFNRFLAAVNTALDPDFVPTNLTRDVQMAAISIEGDEGGKGLGLKIIKSVPKAWKAAWALEHEKEGATGKWAEYARELESEGGLTGYAHLAPYEAMARSMRKDLERGAIANALVEAKRWAYKASGSFETATRLSAYYHLRESGVSAKKAAVITKDLTVNFNDRGELGVYLNSLYLFYNAGVQGSMRVFRSLKSRRVQKIAAGLVFGGAAMDLIMRAMAPDDEDGKNLYDKIPEWVKNRNLIFWIPDAPIVKPGGLPIESVHYFTLPMPYGFSVFHNVGRHASAASVGAETKTEALTGVLASIIDNFNPIAGGGSLAQTISPTFADPFVDVYGNRNWAGRPIAPEFPWAPDTMPESEKYGRNVAPVVRKATTFLNEITGGDVHTSGGVDINPEYVEHFYEFFAGGLGRMSERLYKLASPEEGALREIRDVPILRRFVGAVPEWAVQSDFYSALDHLEQARLRVRDGVGREGDEELAKLRDGVVIKGGAPESLKQKLTDLREEGTAESEKEMYRLMRRFLRTYYKTADQ